MSGKVRFQKFALKKKQKTLHFNALHFHKHHYNKVLMLDKDPVAPLTPPDPGKPGEKGQKLLHKCQFYWHQCTTEYNNFERIWTCQIEIVTTIITVIDSRYYAILLRKKKESQKEKGYHYKEELEKEKFWQSVWRSKHFMHLWVAAGESLFICSHLAQCGGLPSVLTVCETRWGSLSETVLGLESAVTRTEKALASSFKELEPRTKSS